MNKSRYKHKEEKFPTTIITVFMTTGNLESKLGWLVISQNSLKSIFYFNDVNKQKINIYTKINFAQDLGIITSVV